MAKKIQPQTTEEKILAAAKKVFIAKGLSGARMQDIADEAGINKALLHYYFRSKEKLFEMIFTSAAQKLFPKINFIFESDLPLFQKIEQFCQEYLEVMIENPYLPAFLINEINQDPERFIEKIWGKENLPRPKKFLEQIEREVKKGTIKKISPVHLFMNLISMTVFPFVGKSMFRLNMQIDDAQFKLLMEQRKKEIPRFIIDSIKK